MPLSVEIDRPCSLDVAALVPESAPRFHCDHCDREVLVLSHMSEAEARRELARREQPCVAFRRGFDGQIRHREALVPAERLAGPRRLLGAGALLVSVAACAPHGDERVEAVDLAEFAPPEPGPPPRWAGGKRKKPLRHDDVDAEPAKTQREPPARAK